MSWQRPTFSKFTEIAESLTSLTKEMAKRDLEKVNSLIKLAAIKKEQDVLAKEQHRDTDPTRD